MEAVTLEVLEAWAQHEMRERSANAEVGRSHLVGCCVVAEFYKRVRGAFYPVVLYDAATVRTAAVGGEKVTLYHDARVKAVQMAMDRGRRYHPIAAAALLAAIARVKASQAS
jgi:hypothetical protein